MSESAHRSRSLVMLIRKVIAIASLTSNLNVTVYGKKNKIKENPDVPYVGKQKTSLVVIASLVARLVNVLAAKQ